MGTAGSDQDLRSVVRPEQFERQALVAELYPPVRAAFWDVELGAVLRA